MKLSIITPTYNSEKTIEACILSVLNQNFTDYEHIIIDGNSNDNTIAILKKYTHLKWISETDKGIYDAMNKGISMAQGEWLYFLGSDDIIYKTDTFQSFFSEIKSETQIAYGNVKFKNSENIFNGIYDYEKLIMQNICHQAIIYKKNIFEQYGFYKLKYTYLSDYEFNIRTFCNQEIKWQFVNHIISIYNEEGVSKIKFDTNFWCNAETIFNINFSSYLPKQKIIKGLEPYFYYLLHNRKYMKVLPLLLKFIYYQKNFRYLKDAISIIKHKN